MKTLIRIICFLPALIFLTELESSNVIYTWVVNSFPSASDYDIAGFSAAIFAAVNVAVLFAAYALSSAWIKSRERNKQNSLSKKTPSTIGADTVIPSTTQPPNSPSAPPAASPKKVIATPAPVTQYCKQCGGVIDPETKICTKCGKQYFNAKKAWRSTGKILVVLALIVLASLTVIFGMRISELNEQLVTLEGQLATASETIESQKEKIAKHSSTIQSKNLKIDSMSREINALKYNLKFYQNHVVVVPDEYPRVYHRYECEFFKNNSDSFWAYNTEAAKSKGYTACPYCIE